MNILLNKILLLAFLSMLLSACMTRQILTETEAENKYQSVTSLESSINNADQAMLSLLSQRNFKLASEALNKAKVLALKDNNEAVTVASRGHSYFKQAEENTQKSSELFSEVLDARAHALNNGALLQMPKQFKALEIEFKKMTLALENGDIEKAKLHRPTIIDNYQRLGLSSLKKATVDDAKQVLSKARSSDAKAHAKKTFQLAEDELALAVSMLDADKNNKEKADQHAGQAIWLAEKSISITATVKSFRANNFTYEDIVLWHQEQLGKALKPMNMTLPLNLPDKNLTEAIAYKLNVALEDNRKITQQRDDLQASLTMSEKHLKEAKLSNHQAQKALKSKYEVAQQKRNETEAQKQQTLGFIQGLFNSDEANVYREKDNILIRAHGFYFASGQSEIDSRNFSLLQKIASAIAQYPSAKIIVTGHTDAMGNDAKNLTLSKMRANKVMKFLNEIGRISLERLSSEGLGEEKPVASNEEKEGRTANRRVEILIVNK